MIYNILNYSSITGTNIALSHLFALKSCE